MLLGNLEKKSGGREFARWVGVGGSAVKKYNLKQVFRIYIQTIGKTCALFLWQVLRFGFHCVMGHTRQYLMTVFAILFLLYDVTHMTVFTILFLVCDGHTEHYFMTIFVVWFSLMTEHMERYFVTCLWSNFHFRKKCNIHTPYLIISSSFCHSHSNILEFLNQAKMCNIYFVFSKFIHTWSQNIIFLHHDVTHGTQFYDFEIRFFLFLFFSCEQSVTIFIYIFVHN